MDSSAKVLALSWGGCVVVIAALVVSMPFLIEVGIERGEDESKTSASSKDSDAMGVRLGELATDVVELKRVVEKLKFIHVLSSAKEEVEAQGDCEVAIFSLADYGMGYKNEFCRAFDDNYQVRHSKDLVLIGPRKTKDE